MDILTRNAQETAFENHLGIKLPSESVADEVLETTRENGRNNLFFFSTAVCGFDKIQQRPHLELCQFVQKIPKQRKVVLIPRDCFKSTIISKSMPLWILIQKQFCGLPGREHRILCGSFSSENAKKQIKAIRHLIERNTFLQWLYPELIPDFSRTTWTDSNLLFPRDGVYGEDTIEAAGVDTHLVSRHYTVQLKDDLEDEKAMQSPTVRAKVHDWYRTAEALFVNEREAFDLLIGTRWGVDDLYAKIQEAEGDTYEFLTRPLHWTRTDLELDYAQAKETGKPPVYSMPPDEFAPDPDRTYYYFPAIFPEESCKRVRAKQGSFMYSMLYLNNPKDQSLAEFKDSDFRYFDFDSQGNILIVNDDATRETVIFDSLLRVMFWDPAMASSEAKKGDRNAMAVVAKDREGRLFVLDAYIERQNPTFLYSKFISLHKRYQVHKCAVEDVGFQRILKFAVYNAMKEMNYKFPIIEQRPVGEKTARIRALLPYTETHSLFLRRGLKELVEEMKGFPLFPHDDGVDAVAACIPLFGLRAVPSANDRFKSERREERKRETRNAITGY